MMIPFTPESFLALQQRFLAAFEPIYDGTSLRKDAAGCPGTQRQHVLDCEDGVRLIVSRDRLDDGKVMVHLSASVDLTVYDVQRRGWLSPKSFICLAEQHWQALGGPPVTLKLFSAGKGVPHWYGQPREA